MITVHKEAIPPVFENRIIRITTSEDWVDLKRIIDRACMSMNPMGTATQLAKDLKAEMERSK